MGIEKIERFPTETAIHVHEPTRYGEPDRYRKVILHHDGRERAELRTVSSEALARLRSEDPFAVGTVEVATIGTVVFVNSYDDEWGSATYRSGAHSVTGPLLLVP